METCVLIPPELSLVLTTTSDRQHNRFLEMGVRVWTNERVPRGTKFYPFQGTIRLDKLEVYSYLDDDDVRNRFGCFDEVQVADKQQRVRHCNWIRFLRCSGSPLQPDVNLLGSKVKGEPVFETTRTVAAHTELVAHLLLTDDRDGSRRSGLSGVASDDMLAAGAEQLANCTYREAMGMLIEHSPLDLSMALLSSRILITMPSDGAEDSLSPPSDLLRPIMSRVNSFSPMPRRNRERTLLPCEVCGKAFDRPSLLKRHMRTHTGEKPHVCDVCSKGFSTSSSLNTHRRIHSGEKPHMCHCGKRFTASSNLYYHRMTHNKEKPHKCTLCSKSFPTPGDLKSHMYVHSGSWPFKCHICNRGFSKQTNLRNHLFLHTGDKPHVCELCNKRFALSCNLRAHMKTHEAEDPQEECLKCGRQFLASSQSLVHGCCGQCYMTNQGIPLVVAKPSASSHSPSSSTTSSRTPPSGGAGGGEELQRHLQLLHRGRAAAAILRSGAQPSHANWLLGSPLGGADGEEEDEEEEDEMEDDLLLEDSGALYSPPPTTADTIVAASSTARRRDSSSEVEEDDEEATLTESTT